MLALAVTGIIFLLVGLAAYHWLASWEIERKEEDAPPAWFQPLMPILDAAGLHWNAGKWLVFTSAFAVLGLICGFALKNVLAAAVLAAMLGAVPTVYGMVRADKYRRDMTVALATGIEVFASEYSLTRNLPVCFERAARRVPEPVRSEFFRVAKEIYAGYKPKEVLLSFANRLNNRWARQFVNLILLREETGADVGESLFEISRQMRRRQLETWREEAEMAQVKLSYLILMVSTVGLFLYNLPGQYDFLTTDPLGRLIVNAIVLLMMASFGIYLFLNRKAVD